MGFRPNYSQVKCETVSLARRIFLDPSPCRNICLRFLTRYYITGQAPKGILIDRLDRYSISPVWAMLGFSTGQYTPNEADGISDTIRFLLNSSLELFCIRIKRLWNTNLSHYLLWPSESLSLAVNLFSLISGM